MTDGYIKLMRTDEALQMACEDSDAFTLLTVIAWRAKRTSDYNRHGLQVGECLLGDYENYGMTRSKYRSACGRLIDRKLIAKKTTNKGLVVRLLDTRVYDINVEANRQPIASQSPATRHPIATIKNERMKEVINYSADFLKLWNTYPTKATMSKRKAFESFQKTDTPVETLMAAVETLKKSREWKKDAGQFIPHLATWLNGGGWEAAIEIPTSRKAETDTAKQAAQLKEYEQFKTEMSGYVKEANAVALKVKCRGDWKMNRLIRELRPEIKF